MISLASLWACALVAAGCESAGTSGGEGEPVVHGATEVAVVTALPPCNTGQRGHVYYVTGQDTFYYCDGRRHVPLDLRGLDGQDGHNSLVRFRDEPAGANCKDGGLKVETGIDLDDDDVLDDGEVRSADTAYLCSPSTNHAPTISSITADPSALTNGGTSRVVVETADLDGDSLTYAWSSDCGGAFADPASSSTLFVPEVSTLPTPCTLTARVSDGHGGEIEAQTSVSVLMPSQANLQDAVIYSIMIDRFANGDPSNDAPVPGVEQATNFQGGDLRGIQEEIEYGYFEQLGVNVLNLSSPLKGASGAALLRDGHLTSSYDGSLPTELDTVDPRFGGDEALASLVATAHAHGMRVLVEHVPHHVYEESPIYTMHPDWFWPRDIDGIECVCGLGCDWGGDGWRCWAEPYLPRFDLGVPDARKASVELAAQFLHDFELDGLTFPMTWQLDERWLSDLRAALSEQLGDASQVSLVGLGLTNSAEVLYQLVSPGVLLDGNVHYLLREEVTESLLGGWRSLDELDGYLGSGQPYVSGAVMPSTLGTSFLPRSVHLAESPPLFDVWDGGAARAWTNLPELPTDPAVFARLKLAYTVLFTVPSPPFVYYGDEIALPGGGSPDNRRAMPWSESGLTGQQIDLRYYLGRLGGLRASHPALRRGLRTTLEASPDTMTYEISTVGDSVIVSINRGWTPVTAHGLPAGAYRDLFTGSLVTADFVLPPVSATLLVRE